jgi:hypothetical protein
LSANRKLLALVLSIVILPLLVVSAFYASLAVVPTYSPLFHFNFTFPANDNTLNLSSVITTNSNGTFTLYFLNGTLVQQNSPQLFPTIPSSYLTFFAIVLFAVAALGLVYNIRVSRRRNLEFAPLEEEEERERQEIARILDLTISKLREGEEYRKTVLECYKQICDMLEKRSTIEGQTLTAREFKELVSKALELNTPYLEQATELFEKARYSEGEVKKSEAEAAIACLENLSATLKVEKS